jgi:hypothetical protein
MSSQASSAEAWDWMSTLRKNNKSTNQLNMVNQIIIHWEQI